MSPDRQLRVLGVAAIVLLAWTLTPPPPPAPETPTEMPRPAAPPRITITRPPPELIREPPTRADGLDRASPCAYRIVAHRAFSMFSYVWRRRETMDDMLRAEGSAAIGARFRDALGAPGPSTAPPPDDDPSTVRFATLTSLAQGALSGGRTEAAIAYASDAIAIAPDDALGYVLVFLAAQDAGDDALAEAALVHAFRRAPDDAEVASTAWSVLSWTSDVMGRLAAADAMLDLGVDRERWIAERAQLAAMAHVFADGVRISRDRATVIGTHADLEVAAAEHVLDLATRALADTEAALGHGARRELVLYVYPDATTAEAVTCRTPDDATLVRADVDAHDGDSLVADRLHALAMRRAMLLVPWWLREAIRARLDGEGDAEDVQGYARLVASGHWIAPEDMGTARRDPESRDARLARAEARAIVDWLVAHRGEDVLGELTTERVGGGMVREPAARISDLAGALLDEPTLLAFMAERLAAQAHADPVPAARSPREIR